MGLAYSKRAELLINGLINGVEGRIKAAVRSGESVGDTNFDQLRLDLITLVVARRKLRGMQ